ncbi:MAG: RNA methyltransferase [Ruminococcaceae bacterium]|nr:RNA methyltransferase [Oscillospiraceae bacterium]
MPLEIRKSAEIISSRNNPLVVRIGKLEDKKYRESDRLFLFEGVKLLCEALVFGAEVEYILVREDSYERIMKIVNVFLGEREVHSGGTLVRLSASAFGKLSSEKSPEGVITVAKYIDKFHKKGKIEKDSDFDCTEKMLMLESVRDPGNLGTMLRSAAAFGIERVIMSGDCADIYNAKTIRAAMGAVFKVKTLRVESIPESVKALREVGRRVFATALDKDALKLGDFELKPTDVFLIGNEGHGLSENAIKSASGSVFIPMAEGTESLNAAIAASVCMWEISKI